MLDITGLKKPNWKENLPCICTNRLLPFCTHLMGKYPLAWTVFVDQNVVGNSLHATHRRHGLWRSGYISNSWPGRWQSRYIRLTLEKDSIQVGTRAGSVFMSQHCTRLHPTLNKQACLAYGNCPRNQAAMRLTSYNICKRDVNLFGIALVHQ